MKTRLTPTVALLILAYACGAAIGQPPPPPPTAMAREVRNVVLILMDDQSPHLSFLGTPGISTPNLDRLCRQGTYFTRAFAVAASCAPSRASILTGMWPHSSGHWRNTITPPLSAPASEFTRESKTVDSVRIREDIETLPEILSRHGYFTGITQKFHLSPPWKYPFEARSPVGNDSNQFIKVIGDFIRRAGDRPFFIQANIQPPHRGFRATLRARPDIPRPPADAIRIPDYLPDVPGVRADLQEYFASVQVADACAGAILEALDQSGRRDETLVFYTSDNGMPYHRGKASAYPAGTLMPMAAAGPGVAAGTVCDHAVSLIDLMPTFLDALGLDAPSTVQGQSLWPYLTGRGSLPARRVVFAEHNSHGPGAAEHFPQRVATDGRFYYILNLDPSKPQRFPADLTGEAPWHNSAYPAVLAAADAFPAAAKLITDILEGRRPAEELYDLKTDPWALRNLASRPDMRAVLAECRSLVAAWRAQTGDIKKSVDEFKTRPTP